MESTAHCDIFTIRKTHSLSAKHLFLVLLAALTTLSGELGAQALGGMSGAFNSPTAEMMDDGTLALGAHFMDRRYGAYRYRKDAAFEYHALATFATASVLPWLEAQFRYTHLLGREISPQTSYFPDRMVSLRVRLLREKGGWMPSLVLGAEDLAALLGSSSPSYYASHYLVASKRLATGSWRGVLSVGYGSDVVFPWMEGRPERLMQDGLFASASLSHSAWPAGSLLVEYDSRRVNLAARLVFFEQLQILAGLYAFRGFGGGISWRIPL